MITWTYGEASGVIGVTSVGAAERERPGPVRVQFELGRAVVYRGVDGIVDKLRSRLRLVRGEWFLDVREGFPLFQYVLVASPDLGIVEEIIRRAILECPGVEKLLAFRMTLDKVSRRLLVDATVRAVNGYTLTLTQENPFILGEAA